MGRGGVEEVQVRHGPRDSNPGAVHHLRALHNATAHRTAACAPSATWRSDLGRQRREGLSQG